MPIIELQRRMVEAGRIRAGDKGDKGQPQKLVNWRLTSKDKARLDHAAVMWGGEVREWDGQWELYTERESLPIMVTPETQASLWYELWSAGGCQRRCDGVTEMLSDEACLCDADARECKPSLRFSVLLPDLPGIGSWLVQSHGVNAAREIPGTLALLSSLTSQGVLVPARLRLEQRSDKKDGQTRRFAVPVIDIDVTFRELLGTQGALSAPSEQRALPQGYIPIADNGVGTGISLADGLTAAETQTLARKPRVELPEDDVLDDESGASASPPEPSAAAGAGSVPKDAPALPRDQKPTKRMLTKLDVLVGTLRDTLQAITTEQLYSALAKERNVDVTVMVDVLDGAYDEQGVLHWGPLRDSLTRGEASDLIDRLERLETNVGAAA